MKQSTKLLSLVLALIMAFSCMSVIGNAALSKSAVKYDSVDDAVLTPEDVADIALDLVDGLLGGMGDDMYIDLAGIITLDLRSVDNAFSSLCDVGIGTLGTIGWIAGDAADLECGAFSTNGKKNSPYQRSNGDQVIIRQLLKFLYDNAGLVSKIVYGIGTKDGIDLGSLVNGLIDLDDINDIVLNLDKLAISLVYDLLIHGSYNTNYENDSFPASDEVASLPTEVDTLSEIIDYAIAGLLSNPQDYDWVDTDDDGLTDTKVWDPNSKLLPSAAAFGFAAVADYFSVAGVNHGSGLGTKEHTVFEILDKAAPFAIYDLAIPALNHNLKKGLMEAVDADLNIIDKDLVPADVMAVFADESKYVTYIGYDCMAKDEATGDWYYTTLENVLLVDDNGDPILDKDGNEQTTKGRVYYMVNMAAANEFATLIDWDWNIYAPAPGTGDVTIDDVNELNYDALIARYNGTITEALNDIIAIVYNNALTDDVKADFEDVTGDPWVEGATSEMLTYNVERLAKYLLGNFGDKIFGKDSPYADEEVYNYDFYDSMSLIDIVALIGPSFFEDAMPQLIIPQNEDGSYAFATSEGGESVAFLQFGALVIREFMTEITPNVGYYDDYIFVEGSLTDGSGRQFADNEAEEWFNIILNMGLDIAYTYLGQITNFGDTIKYNDAGTALATFTTRSADYLATPPADRDAATTEGRWKDMLNVIIEWAVGYVGQGSYSVLKGFEPNTIKAIADPLDRISYILNTLLPLGFINGLDDGTYDVSATLLVDRIKTLLTTFDLGQLVALFGRNGVGDDDSQLKRGNILNQPVQRMVINLLTDILKLVLGKNIFASASSDAGKKTPPTTLDGLLPQDALKGTVQNLLTSLYESEQRGLIKAALPVVGKFISGWGTEQEFEAPDVDLDSYIKLSSGATSEAQVITVKNNAQGVWRSWVDASGNRYQDEQYKIKLTGVSAYEFDGKTAAAGVSISNVDTTNAIDYGKTATYNLSVSGVTSNKFIRVDTKYQVYEGNNLMTNDTYVVSKYVYLDNTTTDAGTRHETGNKSDFKMWWGYTTQYVDIAGLPGSIENTSFFYLNKDGVYTTNKPNFSIASGSGDGLSGFSTSTITLNDGDRDWDIAPYKSYESWAYGDKADDKADASLITVTSNGFNKAAWDALGKKSGDTGTVTANVAGRTPNSNYSVNKYKDYTATITATFKYYDSSERSDVEGLISKELKLGRVQDDYKSSGVSYADTFLTYTPYTDEDGNEVAKNTNFSDFAWIDDNGEVVTATVTPSENDDTVGTYEVGGEKYAAKKVTVIDNSKVWSNYVTALNRAANAAYTALRSGSDFDYVGAYAALNAAITDLSFAKAEGVANPAVASAIAALKPKLNEVEATYTDEYDYTDYRMHRLNRLNDARDEAQWLIDIAKDANREMADIDSNFPYNGMVEADLKAVVAANASLNIVAGTDGKNIVEALLEELSDEEYEDRANWLDDRKVEYAGVTTFDVAYASDILTKTSTRLLNRGYKVNGDPDLYFIETEIASAEAEIDNDNMDDETGDQIYSDRSWAKYQAALEDAKNVVAGANGRVKSQKNAFDAKWELLCCRNELVLVDEEADYSELEALIAQAEQVMANLDLYDNTAKELGQVLAELGVEGAIVNENGDGVDLFPGSAYYVNKEPYTVDDQRRIDDAANALKEALARLKFKGLDITGSTVEDKVIVAPNEEEGIEAVYAKIATIAAELSAEAVKDLFSVEADNANVGKDNITVSNDLNYTVDTDLPGFAGTNSVVTFYTVQDGIKIPVATVKLVVNGDITGDGVVDAIDAANAYLVSNEKAELKGCYFLAGNLTGDLTVENGAIDADDYSAIVNIVVPN